MNTPWFFSPLSLLELGKSLPIIEFFPSLHTQTTYHLPEEEPRAQSLSKSPTRLC